MDISCKKVLSLLLSSGFELGAEAVAETGLVAGAFSASGEAPFPPQEQTNKSHINKEWFFLIQYDTQTKRFV